MIEFIICMYLQDRSDRERSADSDASLTVSSKFQEYVVPQLVQQIQQKVCLFF